MKVRTILSFILGVIMLGGFLAQMWEVFNQFNSGLKAIAVSFEEQDTIEFPSIAICDSRAYRKLTSLTGNAAQYNATTFNLEEQVSLYIYGNYEKADDWNTSTKELLPTIYNGYCTLHEFHRYYPVTAKLCKFKKLQEYATILKVSMFLSFSIQDVCK